MLDLSVVILNYKTPDETICAIKSVIETCNDLLVEIIVVDNNSNDNSTLLIKESIPNVSIIELDNNKGFAAGMNEGIKASKGQYVLLLNSDTNVLSGAINTMLSSLKEDVSIGICSPKLVDKEGNLSRSLLIVPTVWRLFFSGVGKFRYKQWVKKIEKELLDVECVEGTALLLPRSVIDKVGMLDEGFFFYHEIVDWCMRIKKAGYRVVLNPRAEIMHLCGGSTKSKMWRAAKIELKRTEYYLIRKHFGVLLTSTIITKDFLCEMLNTVLYLLFCLITFCLYKRFKTKLEIHFALLRWLISGMWDRTDSRYIKCFGEWG